MNKAGNLVKRQIPRFSVGGKYEPSADPGRHPHGRRPRPDLWKYIRRAKQVWMECGYFDETFIADARGQVLSRTQIDGDDLTVSTVELAASAPTPPVQQPRIELSPLAYLADNLANQLLVSCYEKNK